MGEKSDIGFSVSNFSEIYGHHMMLSAVAECPTQKCGMLRLPAIVILKLYWYYLSLISGCTDLHWPVLTPAVYRCEELL